MDPERRHRLELEYAEMAAVARQIDSRIWAIYGIYFGALGAGAVVLFRENAAVWQQLVVLATYVLASVSKMSLVGHLQSYSDRAFDRLREIEVALSLHVHRVFEPPPPPSDRLGGFHKWLSRYRARVVMQAWGVIVILASGVTAGFLVLRGGLPSMDSGTIRFTVVVVTLGVVISITVLCATSLLRARIGRNRESSCHSSDSQADAATQQTSAPGIVKEDAPGTRPTSEAATMASTCVLGAAVATIGVFGGLSLASLAAQISAALLLSTGMLIPRHQIGVYKELHAFRRKAPWYRPSGPSDLRGNWSNMGTVTGNEQLLRLHRNGWIGICFIIISAALQVADCMKR